MAWYLLVKRYFQDIAHAMPVRGDRNETMTVNVQELKRISFDLISGGMSDDLGRDLSRKIIVFNAFSLIGILNLVLLGTLAYLQRNPWLAALDYCAAFVLACLIVYLRRTKDYKTAFYCGVGVIGVLYYYLLFTGGVNNTAHVWYFTFPLIASFILGSRPGLAATLLMLVPAVAFFMWENPPSPFTTYSRDFKLRFIPSFLVVTAFAYFFERTREKATMRLEGVNAELKSAVSALQDTEEKLRKAGEQLEQRVEERTAQLYRANLQLAGEMEERKRSEEALRASEGKLNAMLRSVGDSMIMIDRDLNIVWYNDKAKESFALGCDGRKCHEMLCNKGMALRTLSVLRAADFPGRRDPQQRHDTHDPSGAGGLLPLRRKRGPAGCRWKPGGRIDDPAGHHGPQGGGKRAHGIGEEVPNPLRGLHGGDERIPRRQDDRRQPGLACPARVQGQGRDPGQGCRGIHPPR